MGWQQIAARQAGLATRAQLDAVGVRRWSVTHRVRTERWQQLTPTVVATFTGELTAEQQRWLGVLHAGEGAVLGGLTAAEQLGLRNWQREEITVLVPASNARPGPVDGIRFSRSRRSLRDLRQPGMTLPCCRLEPAILLFAAAERSVRTAQGVLAAAVQQERTTPQRLLRWIEDLAPLRRAAVMRQTLADIDGGADSLAEIDVARMCRAYGLAPPRRQVRRRDAHGRLRFTDCEWELADGRVLVLEVDGAFHRDVAQWEDDLARQRALSGTGRVVVRCTSREIRDEPERIAADLRHLGVPRRVVGASEAHGPR